MKNKLIMAFVIFIILLVGGFYFFNNLEISFKQKESLVEYEKKSEVIDVCKNIEGVQSIIPDNFLLDSSGNCFVDDNKKESNETESEVIIKEKIVEKPIYIKEESDKGNNVEDSESDIGIVDVSIVTRSDFDDTEGYYQSPLVVGYNFSNNTDKDVSITGLYFSLDTFGGHYIKDGKTSFSISTEHGNKENGYYFANRETISYSLDESILIEPYSSKNLYLNVWNFQGDVKYAHQSKEQSTTVDLEEVTTNTPNIDFNLGTSGILSTYILHQK